MLVACSLLAFAGPVTAQGRAGKAPTLPLRHVRLYEAGVGYFERSGAIGKTSDLTLPVPPSHLDDALKTLIVVARTGAATVSGVELASSMSADMGRALAGLPLGNGPLSYGALLRSLEGAAVEVRTAHEAVRGRLVDVLEPAEDDPVVCAALASSEVRPAAATGTDGAMRARACERPLTLLVVSERSEIRRLRSSEVIGVKPTDPTLAARLDAGLHAASHGGARGQQKLRILASSTGEVTLGYVAETPVWRSTYRVVLGAADKAALQGWALLHNDTDEDWSRVRVELVNGRPDSFLFPLAAPRYARRPLVTPGEALSTVPQLLGRTVDDELSASLWGDATGDSFGAGGLGLTGIGEGGGGRGEGIGLGAIGTLGHGASGDGASTALAVGDLAAIAEAEGVEAGALFRYALRDAIDLRAHGSALVPFLAETIGARRIAFFSAAGQPARSAVRLHHDAKQTLPGGPVSIFDDGGFAGEAMLDRLKPGETRIVGFGADLDVELTVSESHTEDAPQLFTLDNGILVEHFIRRYRVTHALQNKSGSGRTVMLALDYLRNSAVKGADRLDFDVPSGKALAVLEVAARTEATRRLDIDEGRSRSHMVDTLTSGALRDFAAAPGIPAAQRAILLQAAALLAESEDVDTIIAARRGDVTTIERDLARLHGHLGAMSKESDAGEELGRRVVAGEDRLRTVRGRIIQLEALGERYVARAVRALEGLTR